MKKVTGRHRPWALLLLAILTLAAPLCAPSYAEEEEKSSAVAYFCGKRGDLSAPQCAVLMNELRGRGDEGHVLVCNPGEKVWACKDSRCDEISGVVGVIHHKINLNEHSRLCDLVCGTCKTGWK